MFCDRVSKLKTPVLVGSTHDNGDETHRQTTPEHAGEGVAGDCCEDSLEPRIPDDVPQGEQDKNDDVEDEDDGAEDLEPAGVVREVVEEDGRDAGAHVYGEEAWREVEACSVQSF
jgi:hypothetical protein